MSNPWYLRVIAPGMVADAKPPSPFATSHSRDRSSGREWLLLSQRMERLVNAITAHSRRKSPSSRLLTRLSSLARTKYNRRLGWQNPSFIRHDIHAPGTVVLG